MTSGPSIQTFLLEAEDLLVSIEETALALSPGQPVGEPIHQLFRAFHTLKGSGAMFGLETVAAFTHRVESLLDGVREGRVPVTTELIDLILRAKDHLEALLATARSPLARREPAPPSDAGQPVALEPDGTDIAAALEALLTDTPLAEEGKASQLPAPSTHIPNRIAGDLQTCQIRFRPHRGILAAGANPVALLKELRTLGPCQIVADTAAVPPLEELQADHCYLAWEVTLVTNAGPDAIKDVFIFVEDGSQLSIQPTGPAQSPADPSPVIPSAAVVASAEPPQPSPASCTSAPTTSSANPEPPPEPPGKTSVPRTRRPAAREASVRVPSSRLDRLVGLVGELVMNQSRLSQVAAGAGVPGLAAPVEELDRLVAELRDNILGIRMMPIGTIFGRLRRLVHDLAAELQKEIDFVAAGEQTELDKTVLDQLGDPLVHILRNSIDHGIEPPADRVRLGKPRRGTIHLTAAHTGSSVVVTIADDGQGIDPAAVRARAIERGLLAPEATLTDTDLRELVLRPGFSTARSVTNVSGRGVGMDVVKRQLDALRGHLALTSQPGHGTTLTLTLPLTLAIIDGLLVEVGSEQFIVPMSVVTETVELAREQRHRRNGRRAIAVRGDLVPYVPLREAFALPDAAPELEKIVITCLGEDRVGLVVDRVLGSRQTVIQSLGRFYEHVGLVSGATILGDGRVALILDVAGLIRATAYHPPSPSHPPRSLPPPTPTTPLTTKHP